MAVNNSNEPGSRTEKIGLTLPEQKNYEYSLGLAYKLACERLAGIENIEQQSRKAGVQYQVIDSQKVITIKYLNQTYLITLPDIEISLINDEGKVPIRDKILLLHYLTQAKGTPYSNKTITYKELPGVNAYFPTFSKRTIKPLLKNFGKEPGLLIGAASSLGGYKVDYGDAAVTIEAFNRVPITIVLWRGDDEFAPDGTIMFDASISDYLSNEDVTVLCEIITWRLVNYLRKT